MNVVHNCDCMDFMRKKPDNCYDLAICDPPYFSGPERQGFYGGDTSKTKHSKSGHISRIKRPDYGVSESWDVPTQSYFNELKRISKHQVVFGINYFDFDCGPGRLVWDKINTGLFSDCEIAYVSLHDSVRLVRYMWNGMMQGRSLYHPDIQQADKSKNEIRIHPTQKPVLLYIWILLRYAKTGQSIFDSHVGSGSLRIACDNFGLDFEGCEKDEHHWNRQEERFICRKKQLKLFDDVAELEKQTEPRDRDFNDVMTVLEYTSKNMDKTVMECPVCGRNLHYTRTKRRLYAKCETSNCLSIMT